MSLLDVLKRIDWILLLSVLALTIIGIAFIYSSGIDNEGFNTSNEFFKQIIWAGVSFILMLLILNFDISRYKEYASIVFVAFIFILIYTGLFGKVVNGAKSWIGIGDFGVQPSEFMKIGFMMFLANFIECNITNKPISLVIAKTMGILAIPVGLILLQPDFGTALVFIPTYIFIIYVSGINKPFTISMVFSTLLLFILTILPFWRKTVLKKEMIAVSLISEIPQVLIVLSILVLFLIVSLYGLKKYKMGIYKGISIVCIVLICCISIAFVAQRVLKDYQIMRLVVFMDPSIDPKGSGWNIIQSRTAIGSGGLIGRGFLQGYQSHNRYVPQQSTDFIFSIIAEEWGFIGGVFCFFLMFIILWRILLAIKYAKDVFSSLFCAGIFGMFLFHFFINIGMVMGIMPITGIPLFFLSYGGSSMLVAWISIGIVESVIIHRYREYK